MKSVELKFVRRYWLSINTFGNEKEESGLRDAVEFNVMPLNGKGDVRVEAYLVTEISHLCK